MSILDDTIGAIFIGVMLSAFLWGASCLQTFNYFTESGRDPMIIKIAVILAFLVDSVHQALITQLLYSYTITHFGDVIFLLHIQESLPTQVVLQQLTSSIVQGFFVFRVHRLSDGNLKLIIPVIVLMILQIGASIAFTIGTAHAKTFMEVNQLTTVAIIYAIAVVAADGSLAGILIYLIRQAHQQAVSGHGSVGTKDPFHARVKNVVHYLTVITMTTGLLATTCAIGVFFSYIAIMSGSHVFAYAPFFFIAGRLYFNSLMAALNMRQFIRRKLTGSGGAIAARLSTIGVHSLAVRGAEDSWKVGRRSEVEEDHSHGSGATGSTAADSDKSLPITSDLRMPAQADRVVSFELQSPNSAFPSNRDSTSRGPPALSPPTTNSVRRNESDDPMYPPVRRISRDPGLQHNV